MNTSSLTTKRLLTGCVLSTAVLSMSMADACCNIDGTRADPQIDSLFTATTNIYNQLKDLGCTDFDSSATESCSGEVFKTWQNVRALIHTANELSGLDQGSTEFSLGVDAQGLVEAIRWNTGEEFANQYTMSTQFASNVLASINSRISTLRAGSGLATNGFTNNALAQRSITPKSGLNAGDNAWSRWGGFINTNYSKGNLDPSAHEDAFDFDGSDINAGVDYRLDDHWVAGAMFAYVKQDVDFDASLSVVDAQAAMKGMALSAFALYQSDAAFYSASLGYGTNTYTTDRGVHYTSNNLSLPSPDTIAVSENKSRSLNASFNAGFTVQVTDYFTVEPSVAANYQRLSIAAFNESDINNDGFNLRIFEQNFNRLDTVAELKLQYLFNTSVGVFMPYLDVQTIEVHNAKQRKISAVYANIADNVSADAYLNLLTDKPETHYRIWTLGVASVLRGASQKEFGAAANGGIQAFLNYSQYSNADTFHQQMISAGIRYEF